MGRRKQPELADRLLDACTDVALAHGLPERLEPFVAGTGVSSRMLIYHFGTRDALRRAVLRRARERQRALFEQLMLLRDDESYLLTLRRAWAGMTDERGRQFLSLFGRLREDPEQQLWPDFRSQATTDWLAPLEAGLASLGRAQQATLVLAVIRGLIMDLEATHDADRVDQAFDAFIDTLAGSPG